MIGLERFEKRVSEIETTLIGLQRGYIEERGAIRFIVTPADAQERKINVRLADPRPGQSLLLWRDGKKFAQVTAVSGQGVELDMGRGRRFVPLESAAVLTKVGGMLVSILVRGEPPIIPESESILVTFHFSPRPN